MDVRAINLLQAHALLASKPLTIPVPMPLTIPQTGPVFSQSTDRVTVGGPPSQQESSSLVGRWALKGAAAGAAIGGICLPAFGAMIIGAMSGGVGMDAASLFTTLAINGGLIGGMVGGVGGAVLGAIKGA